LHDLASPIRKGFYHGLRDGFVQACTCDIRIAAENAMLGDAHSKIGAIGGGGSTQQRLPRLVGVAKAKELTFSGDFIDAREAERIGLVNRVVVTESLLDEAKKLVFKGEEA